MLGELAPRRFFWDAWREIDGEVAREREGLDAGERAAAGPRALLALVVAACMLTALEYGSDRGTFLRLARQVEVLAPLRDGPWRELAGFAWWSLTHVLGYFVIPAFVARRFLSIGWGDDGLSFEGTRGHGRLYGTLLLLVLPVIIGASFLGDFADYYPFYNNAARSWVDLIAWEVLYLAQFFALEYFFRGFLIATCRPAMGSSAIFAMIVPYCMIHYGKPMLEAYAAIFAGLVLGTLAMRTRSIWGGVAVHATVAVTMDVAALLQGPGLPTIFWPHL
jgi:membrane protease YdiL (CAAX protease family)